MRALPMDVAKAVVNSLVIPELTTATVFWPGLQGTNSDDTDRLFACCPF